MINTPRKVIIYFINNECSKRHDTLSYYHSLQFICLTFAKWFAKCYHTMGHVHHFIDVLFQENENCNLSVTETMAKTKVKLFSLTPLGSNMDPDA